jgi:hypothetical protein
VRPGEAVMKLVSMGYHFDLVGEKVRYEWRGHGVPHPAQVRSLLETVKAHKPEVLALLGKPPPPKRILTCADCSFHEYQGPNPVHGWGRCTFNEKWCYGLRRACTECKK